MNASARAATPDLGIDPIYTLRDDLAHSLNPVNAHERMLVTAIAQAWTRLQQAYELETRIFQKTDPFELFSNDFEKFKAISRHITECERIWRRAIEELQRTQRRRAASTTSSPRSRPRPHNENFIPHATPVPPKVTFQTAQTASESSGTPAPPRVAETAFADHELLKL